MKNFNFKRIRGVLGNLANIGWFYYWSVFLIFSLVLFVGVIVFELGLYFNIEKNKLKDDNTTFETQEKKLESIDQDNLLKINYYFSQKSSKLERIKEGKFDNIIDPSR